MDATLALDVGPSMAPTACGRVPKALEAPWPVPQAPSLPVLEMPLYPGFHLLLLGYHGLHLDLWLDSDLGASGKNPQQLWFCKYHFSGNELLTSFSVQCVTSLSTTIPMSH